MKMDWGLDRSPTNPPDGGTLSTEGRRQPEAGPPYDAPALLTLQEPTAFDPDRLEVLCATLGETCAEAEVALALERIATSLAALDRIRMDGDPRVLSAAISALARDADMIGMTTLAHVASVVLGCLRQAGEETALAATMARLTRVGERSMHAVWDLDDSGV